MVTEKGPRKSLYKLLRLLYLNDQSNLLENFNIFKEKKIFEIVEHWQKN